MAALVLATLGGRMGIPVLIERLYRSTTTLAAGGWVAVATALSPFTSPLPQALIIGGPVLSVP